jgi:Zn-dependent M28 family amino/carboxypeptidase
VKNILARISGTDNTGEAMLLASHYDSMPTTNAAADGAVSVATVLETLRVIQAGPTPKNPA